MNRNRVLGHEFIEYIPDDLQQGTIYVSTRFATATHLCCCGCGNKVVTPIHPTDWKLIFDGKTVSLDPSIGNWSLPCQSHYWIRNNRVNWAARQSKAQIERGRLRDRQAKQDYFSDKATDPEGQRKAQTGMPNRTWPRRVKKWW